MVKLQIKRGDENQFLYDTPVDTSVDDALNNIVVIYNGRLKISRICAEMEELAKHGVMLPPEILGLTDEQVQDFKLVDTWGEKCIPSGGFINNRDPIGRRNGRQPQKNMQDMITKTVEEAKGMVTKKLVDSNKSMTQKSIKSALDILRGAVTIVYPMGLPPHDPIRQEFENTEDLAGMQASLEVIDPTTATLWFSGKEMLRGQGKVLQDYVGRNDKCKMIVKLQKRGEGPPGREPVMPQDDRKMLMMKAYRRQEELKGMGPSRHSSHSIQVV